MAEALPQEIVYIIVLKILGLVQNSTLTNSFVHVLKLPEDGVLQNIILGKNVERREGQIGEPVDITIRMGTIIRKDTHVPEIQMGAFISEANISVRSIRKAHQTVKNIR